MLITVASQYSRTDGIKRTYCSHTVIRRPKGASPKSCGGKEFFRHGDGGSSPREGSGSLSLPHSSMVGKIPVLQETPQKITIVFYYSQYKELVNLGP